MKVHYLRCIAPVLGDRVILLWSGSQKFDDMVDEELVFARILDDDDDDETVWMIDETHEELAIEHIENLGGNDCWCKECSDYDNEGRADETTCDVWCDETDRLGFEPTAPLKEGEEDPVAEGGFKLPEGLKQFLKKEVGGPLADFAKGRVKQIAKDQAKSVGVTLEDSFFDDLYEAFSSFSKDTVSNGVKSMSVEEAAKLLAVKWPCTQDDVVAGYRAMAKMTHPDRPGGSAEAFMRVVEARTVLNKALG